MLRMLSVDTTCLMETGYSLLMDSRSAANAKKLLTSNDFRVHVQHITGFTSDSLEAQSTVAVILRFILFCMLKFTLTGSGTKLHVIILSVYSFAVPVNCLLYTVLE